MRRTTDVDSVRRIVSRDAMRVRGATDTFLENPTDANQKNLEWALPHYRLSFMRLMAMRVEEQEEEATGHVRFLREIKRKLEQAPIEGPDEEARQLVALIDGHLAPEALDPESNQQEENTHD